MANESEDPETSPDRESEDFSGRESAVPSDEGSDAPLSELRAEIESREGDVEARLADRFLEKGIQGVDSEAIWADLLMESGDAEGALEPIDVEDDGEYQLVSKRMCHRCQYFGDPPTLHCTHEGTTIHQVVDTEQFRVSNCPMIDRSATMERRRGETDDER